MSTKNSETGHAKNIANMNLLLTNIVAIGADYNPTNPKLDIAELQNLYALATKAQKDVNEAMGPYKTAVAERENTFEPLGKLITKLRRVYKATEGVQPNNVENFMTLARKIRGNKKNATPNTTDPTAKENEHSVSQTSYDQKANHFDQLISILQHTSNYNPNEEEYKIATLKTLHTKMLAKTAAVAEFYVPLNNLRSTRNTIMYQSPNNLVDTVHKAKDYVFTILDIKSAQYKNISKIRFSKI